jgi:hypothetical protein
MELVEKPGTVLAKATSMWAVYGGIAVLVLDYGTKWLQSDASAGLSPEWRDGLLGVCLILAPIFRVIKQRSLQPPVIRPMGD